MTEHHEQHEDEQYIIFDIAGDLYGTKLLEIREVIEEQPIKSVANTIPAFEGVLNLRGQIIGVINLRKHWSLPSTELSRKVVFIFDTDSGAIGALVDSIITVAHVPEHAIDRNANIVTRIPSKYLKGIGQLNQRLFTIINLKDVLSKADLLELSHINNAA
jgi:purine-binding chemotaxis protein CheW